MSTSTLELIELNVDLDAEIPCEAHQEVPAHFRVAHVDPSCSFFVCAPCQKQIQRVLETVRRHLMVCPGNKHAHEVSCAKCDNVIDPDTIRITSLD